MKRFDEFVVDRRAEAVAAFFVENGINVEQYASAVYDLASVKMLNETELYNELMGLLGGLSGLGKSVAGGVGNAFRNVAGDTFNAAKSALSGVAQDVGSRFRAGADAFSQGRNQANLNGAVRQIQGLQNNLKRLGYADPTVDNAFGMLTKAISTAQGNLKTNPGMKLGQGTSAFSPQSSTPPPSSPIPSGGTG